MLGEAQVGRSLTLQVAYVDGFGGAETVRSGATGAVANLNDPGLVTLTSDGAATETLSAGVSDPDGLGAVSWRWQSSGDGLAWFDIGGATGASFVRGAAHQTVQVRAQASYTDLHGTPETVVSAALGGRGADQLIGTGQADAFDAGSGNDSIRGGGGNDVISGGAGIDTALYAGPRSRYTIVHTANGYQVTDTTGAEGVDTLVGVERLQFGGGALALDTGADGIGGKSYRLYQAAFGRTPDLGGVGFWMHAMDEGMPLADIAAGFVASAEYQALYPATLGNVELVTRYYVNILGRTPEQAGLDYWAGVLDRHIASVPQVLAFISESQENIDLTALVIGNGFPYTPYP